MSDKAQSTAAAEKAARDNRSDQFNPNNPKHQGATTKYTGEGTKADLDNHAKQLNPTSEEYGGGKKKWQFGWYQLYT